MWPLYTELKGWQGAIGSLLGFVALIVGALFNFRLNRRRDALLRQEEVVAIASALYGEIVLQRQAVARMANAVGAAYLRAGLRGGGAEPFDRHFAEQFAMPEPRLYAALAGRIGMLPSTLALQIVRFHSQVEEARAWLPRLGDEDGRPYSYGVNYVLDPAIDAVTEVAPALRRIEEMAGIAVPAETPDIARALSAQAVETDQLEAMREDA